MQELVSGAVSPSQQVADLREPVSAIVSGLLDFESPWAWALSIIEESVRRYKADVSTLWKIDGNKLRLVGGHASGGQPLSRGHSYELDWSARSWEDLAYQGITAGVALLNEAISIDSIDALKMHPARRGHLDKYLYGDIPGGPLCERSGFGCLFAVPLRIRQLQNPTEGTSVSRVSPVAGVFKIERRRHNGSFTPFDDADKAAFELVADSLEYLLQQSHSRKSLVSRQVERVLKALPPVSLDEHQQRTDLLVNFGAAFRSMALIGMDVAWARHGYDLLRLDLPEAIVWIERIREGIGHELRPRSGNSLTHPSKRRPVDLSTPRDSRASAEMVRDQVLALLQSAEAQPLPSVSAGHLTEACPEALVRKVTQGFAGRDVPQKAKDEALANLMAWLFNPGFAEYHPQLEWFIDQQQWPVLLDSFHQMLPFGTGGRRGSVGIGTNRFNPVTLRSSVQGHVKYLSERYPGQDLAVVIAFDVREFRDLRAVYNPHLRNPLIGMTSRRFAQLAAEEYSAHLVKVYFPRAGFMSTPELSFAIRFLEAHGGLNISASHNHPDDNGGKFFGSHGGQEVPPFDARMAEKVDVFSQQGADQGPRLSTKLGRMPLGQAEARGLFLPMPKEVHQAYLDANLRQSLRVESRNARIVFTSLHGTGSTSALEVLQQAGFDVEVVHRQSTFDGSFPTVPFRAPNPEVPESMRAAINVAQQFKADLVLACDPDADRIGACVRANADQYRFLTGNEIALLVTKYKLETLKDLGRLPSRPFVIKTEVTTELLRPVVQAFGSQIIGNLLVGFKYHADVLNQIEKNPEARTERLRESDLTLSDFVIATEESHGVLISHEMRDKDAAGAALLLAELASVQRSKNKTIADYLDEIYLEHGYSANIVRSMVMSGAEGLSQIRKIQEALRRHPPNVLAGLGLVGPVVDRQDPSDPVFGAILGETDRVARNVLIFHLENGAKVVIRPSGTEPKNKIYVEVPSPALGIGADIGELERTKASTNAIAHAIADDLTRFTLKVIGLELPLYALRISGLVPLDRRIDFVRGFMPSLESHVRSQQKGVSSVDAVSEWIDRNLGSYGEDARGLVSEAVAVYVAGERARTLTLSIEDRNERLHQLKVIDSFFGLAEG